MQTTSPGHFITLSRSPIHLACETDRNKKYKKSRDIRSSFNLRTPSRILISNFSYPWIIIMRFDLFDAPSFPPWTFYHLNKKPLWSFPPFGHRTIRISEWKSGFQQFFVLMGTKFKFCEHINYIIIRDDIKNFSFKICMEKINPWWHKIFSSKCL